MRPSKEQMYVTLDSETTLMSQNIKKDLQRLEVPDLGQKMRRG